MQKPLFITCEGGEGAGKSTLLTRLKKDLQGRGYEVVTTREPGGSKLGEYIRQWLLNRHFEVKIGSKAELLLFLTARAQHIEELIKPALEAGKIVLCDRFNDSTVAYQGYARGLGADYVQALCNGVCEEIIPKLTFFLDVAPEVGLERTRRAHKENAKAGELDRMESEKGKFHEKVRQGLQALAKQNPERIHVLDASKPADYVFAEARRILEAQLLK